MSFADRFAGKRAVVTGGASGIGFGVAIPHGRAPSVPDLAVVCGTTLNPSITR